MNKRIHCTAALVQLMLIAPTPAVRGEPTVYYDEAAFLSALSAAGYAVVHEDFEDASTWGMVQVDDRPETAPRVTHLGVTWTGFGGGVHVENLIPRSGHWIFASSPHGYPADGFGGTGTTQPMLAVGGWVRSGGNGGVPIDVQLILNNDPNNVIGTQGQGVGPQWFFFGVIDPAGITSFEFHTEAVTPPDAGKQIFAEDFTFAFAAPPPVGPVGSRWISATGGSFGAPANWDTGMVPGSDDAAIFDLSATTPYSVSFAQNRAISRLVLGTDAVSLALSGHQVDLLDDNITEPALVAGEQTGDAGTLTIADGTVTAANVLVAAQTGVSAALEVPAGGVVDASHWLRVGAFADAALNLTGGGQVSAVRGSVGEFGGTGLVHADGPGTLLHIRRESTFGPGGELLIGHGGSGSLSITGGAHVQVETDLLAALRQGTNPTNEPNGPPDPAGVATISVSDPNSLLDVNDTFGGAVQIAVAGPADLSITSGARLATHVLETGIGGDSTVLLDGAGSSIELVRQNVFARGTLSVGKGDQAGSFFSNNATYHTTTMTVSGGATLSSELAYIGQTRTGIGTLTITGPGSSWTNTADWTWVGYEGDGTLNILDGASVTSGPVAIGRFGVQAGNVVLDGVVNVDGPGSMWTVTGVFLLVGYNNEGLGSQLFNSHGTLNVTGGATVSAPQLALATRDSSHGTVLVSGPGSTISVGSFGVLLGDSFTVNTLNSDAALRVENGAALSSAGDIDVWFGTITLSDGTITAPAVRLVGRFLNDPNATIPALAGSGQIDGDLVIEGGFVSPDGELGISGDYGPAPDPNFGPTPFSILTIDVTGTTPGVDFDRLVVGGSVNLSGTLEIRVDPNYVPSAGDSFEIISASNVTGAFTTVSGTHLPNGATFVVDTSDPTRVVLRVQGPPCPADLDGDGSIGLTDLAALLSNFGTSGATPADGDLDGDGDVDLSDLSALLAVFGTSCL